MAHGKMPKTLHRDLIAVAESVAPVLARDIEKVGPLWFPDRSGDVTQFRLPVRMLADIPDRVRDHVVMVTGFCALGHGASLI